MGMESPALSKSGNRNKKYQQTVIGRNDMNHCRMMIIILNIFLFFFWNTFFFDLRGIGNRQLLLCCCSLHIICQNNSYISSPLNKKVNWYIPYKNCNNISNYNTPYWVPFGEDMKGTTQ